MRLRNFLSYFSAAACLGPAGLAYAHLANSMVEAALSNPGPVGVTSSAVKLTQVDERGSNTQKATLKLSSEVVWVARSLAAAEGKSLGQFMSDVVQSEVGRHPSFGPLLDASPFYEKCRGFPTFDVPADAPPLTPDKVREVLKPRNGRMVAEHSAELAGLNLLDAQPQLALDSYSLTALLDMNVLLALAWPNHVDHARAQLWFANHRAGWALCPTTNFGFLWASDAIKTEDTRPRNPLKLLKRIAKTPGHVFWTDDGYTWRADFHLLALAVRNGGRLVTLDRSIRGKLDPKSLASRHLLEL